MGLCTTLVGMQEQNISIAGSSFLNITDNVSEGSVVRGKYTWEYKIENGYLYKRKYNTITQKADGEWILVGPVNEAD